MKKNKISKLLLSVTLVSSVLFIAACGGGAKPSAGNYAYSKSSEELLFFKSSDSELDAFLNDYFKRHSGYVDEKGQDQKVNSVTAGVNAKQFFWQEWNSMSYYWYNSFDGYETDRIEGLRKILSNIPVDDYGYVWQETDAVRDNYSTTNTGEHRMGWPFPTSYNVDLSTSWDFNGVSTERDWSSRYSSGAEYFDNDSAAMKGGLYETTVEGVSSVEFTSPTNDYTLAYYSPLLEIDLRMYTADCANVEDIIVHYTTDDPNEWYSVSVNEKAFIAYDYTPSYEHIIFLPMYAEENWKSDKECETFINQIRIEIKAKEGKTLSGKFALNYVRSTFDTRHVNNNSIFISSLRQDYDYTGDIEYLKENITKARKAMNFYMEMYDEERHLNDQAYLVGHDSDKTSFDKYERVAMTLANGYWDISFMTRFDFQTNVYFYKAITDLAYLENILLEKGVSVDKSDATIKTADRNFTHGTREYTYTGEDLNKIAGDVLAALRQSTNDADKTGFWSEETGRFVGGYSEADEKWYDYGYTVWNMEAIYYGVATEEQAKSIMDWVSGKRTVAMDEYGSQGKDIYFFEFAPRVNTYSDENQNDLSIFNGSYNNSSCIYGETQVQNGGAIMYVSFFDLMSRIHAYGADDAYTRLLGIKDWYMDIYDYYVSGNNYNKNPDRFYWDYYEKSQWDANGDGKGDYYALQNGIKGTAEREAGPNGVMGIDGEFLESFLMVSAIPYGFFGIDTANGNTLKIQPNLPKDLTYWGMENLAYNKVKYDLTIFENSVKIDSVRGNASGIRVQVTLEAKGNNPSVYVNGRQTSDYTVKDGKVTVSVPLASVTVEVK